jgi:hypothetical protein
MLAESGAFTAEAVRLFAAHGQTGAGPRPWMFDRSPTEADWRLQLSAQTRLTIGPQPALDLVRAAWTAAVEEADRDRR